MGVRNPPGWGGSLDYRHVGQGGRAAGRVEHKDAVCLSNGQARRVCERGDARPVKHARCVDRNAAFRWVCTRRTWGARRRGRGARGRTGRVEELNVVGARHKHLVGGRKAGPLSDSVRRSAART